MSMFVFLNSTLRELQKVSLLNIIVNNKKYLFGRNIDHKSISVREYMVYCLLLTQQIPIYISNISTYKTKYIRRGNSRISLGPIHQFSFLIV